MTNSESTDKMLKNPDFISVFAVMPTSANRCDNMQLATN